MEGLNILKSEIRIAMNKMQKDKATGQIRLSQRYLQLQIILVDKITKVGNKIFNSGKTSKNINGSILIAKETSCKQM